MERTVRTRRGDGGALARKSALVAAVAKDNAAVLERLLAEEGGALAAAAWRGPADFTLLHLAAVTDSAGAVAALARATGVPLDSEMLYHGSNEVQTFLEAQGITVPLRDTSGSCGHRTPLFLAALLAHEHAAVALAEAGASFQVDRHQFNSNIFSALMRTGNSSCAGMVLRRLLPFDPAGFEQAALEGWRIKSSGAKVVAEHFATAVRAGNFQPSAAQVPRLVCAALAGDDAAFQLFLAAAPPEQTYTAEQTVPIIRALLTPGGSLPMLQRLLDSPLAATEGGGWKWPDWGLLAAAMLAGRPDMAAALMEAGASVAMEDVHEAMSGWDPANIDALETLLALGVTTHFSYQQHQYHSPPAPSTGSWPGGKESVGMLLWGDPIWGTREVQSYDPLLDLTAEWELEGRNRLLLLAATQLPWSPAVHARFPRTFRRAVATLVLAAQRDGGGASAAPTRRTTRARQRRGATAAPNLLGLLPREVLLATLQQAAYPLSAWAAVAANGSLV
eukprot:scaffold1.g5675.t1